MSKGRFTLPGEKGLEKEMALLIEKWGADAVRDCDGTELSGEAASLGANVYSTLCLIRADNEWAKRHPECRQQFYLMSEPMTARSDILEIDIMKGYFAQQFLPNDNCNLSRYWQVYDRTEGVPVPVTRWSYRDGVVTVMEASHYHVYTVSFLAYQIWEPVSMRNHITNGWAEEHKLPVDIRYPEAQDHLLNVLDEWLAAHPSTDVVRFTTFFYNFDLVYNESGKEKRVDWFGYLSCVSPLALTQFEQKYGVTLAPEDFVDAGQYNTLFKNPSDKYLLWIEFNAEFVSAFAKKCVELVHHHGKKALMFFGDHWAGAEPYGRYFKEIGLDAVVGAARDGVTTRMIADVPVAETEVRLHPYFFPDVFYEGGDPVFESERTWLKCRRALLRSPVQRMGYGGYLSLALRFPDFVEHVAGITEQFRQIHEMRRGAEPWCAPFKVGILNSWGGLRSWQTHQVAHSTWNQRCYSYLGILEALAGLPFEVVFLSFDDVEMHGVPDDVGVLINAGDAGTSWSGGDRWRNPRLVARLRKWVDMGGGFIGVGEPTASYYQGAFFQLWDVLGVQKELGFTAGFRRPALKTEGSHFITEDVSTEIDYGEGSSMIYASRQDTLALDVASNSLSLACGAFGNGRSVYLAGLPYSLQNSRLLHRTLFWCAGMEQDFFVWNTSNPMTECSLYPDASVLCVTNNSGFQQKTTVFSDDGGNFELVLEPYGWEWIRTDV